NIRARREIVGPRLRPAVRLLAVRVFGPPTLGNAARDDGDADGVVPAGERLLRSLEELLGKPCIHVPRRRLELPIAERKGALAAEFIAARAASDRRALVLGPVLVDVAMRILSDRRRHLIGALDDGR